MEVLRGSKGRIAIGTVAAALSLHSPAASTPTSMTEERRAPKEGSRVGVSRRVIEIGMHAPLTGATFFPDRVPDQAKDIYFRWLRLKGLEINGRNVRVTLRNDNSNPTDALEACKELVREERVFALVGFSGVDQMQTCAGYAAKAHIPYISPGSTERRMDLPQTFATTMTWPDQGKLLADFFVTQLKARKRGNAMVWHNTANAKGAHTRFVEAMNGRDADVYSRSAALNSNMAEASAIIAELEARDIENVYVHVTPSFYTKLLQAAAQGNYTPQWTGIDWALQSRGSATTGCDSSQNADGAKFFSPYPALADRDRFDKKFDRAMNRFHPYQEAHEVHWGNWAQQKVIARLLRRPGRNLTRSRFVYFAERARKVKTGVGPRLRFRPKNHFGARQVHLNRLDCDEREWRTRKAFVSDFKRKKKR